MKRWLRRLVIAISALGVAAVLAGLWMVKRRHPHSNPIRKAACIVMGCPTAVGLDRICGLFAEAEFVIPDADPAARLRWVEAAYTEAPHSEAALALVRSAVERRDVGALYSDATDAGGNPWICPALARALAP